MLKDVSLATQAFISTNKPVFQAVPPTLSEQLSVENCNVWPAMENAQPAASAINPLVSLVTTITT
jgi:hypothetical protein